MNLIDTTCTFFTVGSSSYYSNYFNTVNNPSFVYGRFYCYGTENKLADCSWDSYYCSYYEIAGVHCEGKPKFGILISLLLLNLIY